MKKTEPMNINTRIFFFFLFVVPSLTVCAQFGVVSPTYVDMFLQPTVTSDDSDPQAVFVAGASMAHEVRVGFASLMDVVQVSIEVGSTQGASDYCDALFNIDGSDVPEIYDYDINIEQGVLSLDIGAHDYSDSLDVRVYFIDSSGTSSEEISY